MNHHPGKSLLVVFAAALGIVWLNGFPQLSPKAAEPPKEAAAKNNEELARL